MRDLAFLIPGDLDTRTGGYGYNRRLIHELREMGWVVDVRRLGDSFPHPNSADRQHAVDQLTALPDGALVLIDGLAYGALPQEVEQEHRRVQFMPLVHLMLAHETGLTAEAAAMLEESERRALAYARMVIATGRTTVRALTACGVPDARILLIEPGTDPAPLATGSGSSCCRVLCVASVTPRKGYETLVRALADVRDLDWVLTCVGSLDRAPDTARRVRQVVAEAGLASRITFRGELGEEEVAACYHAADLFVLPTFHESYGMVFAEAIARGLPVISTPTGAVRDLVGDDAGILIPAADVGQLAEALRRFMSDPALRARLVEGARARRHLLPSWRDVAQTFARAMSAQSNPS